MSERTRPDRQQAHLIVAAVRVLSHREARPPSSIEVADLLEMSPELTQVVVRQIVELGILNEVADAYEARLEVADLTGAIDLPTDHYDAVTCVGTFTLGHVGPSALGELIRVTRPGGYVCFTVRDEAWERDPYSDRLQALVDADRWSEVSVEVVPYIEEEGSTCHVCLYRVAPA